jgi:hypothetical protein
MRFVSDPGPMRLSLLVIRLYPWLNGCDGAINIIGILSV